MKRVAVFPGTFDPITFGHLDIINRAIEVVDSLVVAVAVSNKKQPMFTVEDRVAMVQDSVKKQNVSVEMFDGLLADFLNDQGIYVVVRGVRCTTDFDRELRMWHINRKLNPRIEAMFMPASDKHQYTSSSFVREISCLGGDISEFVPINIVEKLQKHARITPDKIDD